MRRVVTSCVALTLAGMPAMGQGGDPARTHPGSLRVTSEIAGARGLTMAQRAAATAVTDRIVAILRRDPAIAHPVGYSVVLKSTARVRLPGDAPGMPFHSIVFGVVKYFETTDNGRGGRDVVEGNGGFDFQIAVNAAGYREEMEGTDSEPDRKPRIMGADPANTSVYRVTGTFRGRPIYGGSCTYLTNRTVPPIVPVTKERYLTVELLKMRATSARHDAQRAAQTSTPSNDALQRFLRDRPAREASNRQIIATLRQSGADSAQIRQATEAFRAAEAQQEAALRANIAGGTDQRIRDATQAGRAGEADRIAKAQSDLDALSPADRRSQAIVVPAERDQFTLAETVDTIGQPLVQPNAAFYDASLPPDAPQLLWICADHLQGLEDKSYDRLAEGSAEWLEEKARNERRVHDVVQIRDQLDWAALHALIKP